MVVYGYGGDIVSFVKAVFREDGDMSLFVYTSLYLPAHHVPNIIS